MSEADIASFGGISVSFAEVSIAAISHFRRMMA